MQNNCLYYAASKAFVISLWNYVKESTKRRINAVECALLFFYSTHMQSLNFDTVY